MTATIANAQSSARSWVLIGEESRICPQHGAYVAQLHERRPAPTAADGMPRPPLFAPRWTSCPTCDAELQREADARDEAIRGGMTERQRLAAARLRAAGIPPRFEDATIWTWQHGMDQQRRVWGAVRDYANAIEIALQTGRNLVFSGGPGTGKTHLALGLLRHVIEKGGTGLYTTAADLVGRIRATFARDAERTEQDVLDELTSVDLLVIDEVGRQLETTHEQVQLFRVLDTRYRNLKPVVMVSNLDKAALVAFLGDALVDRLREGGGAVLVFDWASQRSARKRDVAEGAA